MSMVIKSLVPIPGCQGAARVEYAVTHSTPGRDGTTLEQPLALFLRPGGACEASMAITECNGATPAATQGLTRARRRGRIPVLVPASVGRCVENTGEIRAVNLERPSSGAKAARASFLQHQRRTFSFLKDKYVCQNIQPDL